MTSGHPALATRFTELVGSRLPVVQTGMGWVSGARLTAATSAAGGFGILAGVTLSRDDLNAAIGRVRDRTDAPFGVNLRPDQPDLDDRIGDLVAAGIKLASFAGPPTAATIQRLHDHGILVMPTVGARRHAEKMVEAGADVVIAQGAEGGGHTGSVPTTLLLPQVIDAVGSEVPVLAAGGFRDGRGLAAALTWGADGMAMGTRFLLTSESHVPDAVKQRYLAAGPNDTVVTLKLDGAPQRVIRTDTVDDLEASGWTSRAIGAARSAARLRASTGTSWLALVREGWGMRRNQDLTWMQVMFAAHAPMLIRSALVEGDTEVGVLPTGQVTGVIDDVPSVADLLDEIETDALQALRSQQSRLIGNDTTGGQS